MKNFLTIEKFRSSIVRADMERVLIEDVDLSVESGQVLVIAGPTGSGKSTLLKAIPLIHDPMVILDGSICLNGASKKMSILENGKVKLTWSEIQTPLRLRHIGYIPQEPSAAFNPRFTVKDHFFNKLENLAAASGKKPDKREFLSRTESALDELGVGKHIDALPDRLSGGEQQRVVIALAFISQPKFVLADEPFQDLDFDFKEEVLGVFETRIKNGTGAIIVTHNIDAIRSFTSRKLVGHVCLLKNKRPDDPRCLTHVLDNPTPMDRFFIKRDGMAGKIVQSYLKKAEAASIVIGSVNHPMKPVRENNSIIWARDLRYKKKNSDRIILEIDRCEIPLGKVVSVVGPNGAGKTTLLKALAGLESKVDQNALEIMGKIHYNISEDGRNLAFEAKELLESKKLRGKVQLVFQEPGLSMDPSRDLIELLLPPRKNFFNEKDPDVLREKIQEAIAFVEYPEFLRNAEGPRHSIRFPDQYSEGQKQRVCLARALLCQPDVLLLDEPLSSLDPSTQDLLTRKIFNLEKLADFYQKLDPEGKRIQPSVISITHDRLMSIIVSDYLIFMENGKIIDHGHTRDIIARPELAETRKFVDDLKKNVEKRINAGIGIAGVETKSRKENEKMQKTHPGGVQ